MSLNAIKIPALKCPKCDGRKKVLIPAMVQGQADRWVQCACCAGKGVVTPEDARRNVRYGKFGARSVDTDTVWVTCKRLTDTQARAMEWPEHGTYIRMPVVNPQGTGFAYQVETDRTLVGKTVLVPSLKENAWVPAVVEDVSETNPKLVPANQPVQQEIPFDQPEIDPEEFDQATLDAEQEALRLAHSRAHETGPN